MRAKAMKQKIEPKNRNQVKNELMKLERKEN